MFFMAALWLVHWSIRVLYSYLCVHLLNEILKFFGGWSHDSSNCLYWALSSMTGTQWIIKKYLLNTQIGRHSFVWPREPWAFSCPTLATSMLCQLGVVCGCNIVVTESPVTHKTCNICHLTFYRNNLPTPDCLIEIMESPLSVRRHGRGPQDYLAILGVN